MTATVSLGIDIGTTGTKVVAFDAADGRLLAVSRSVRAHTDGPGIAEADCAEWIENTVSAVADLIAHHGVDPRRIASISTTGMVPAVVALNDEHLPLRRAILQSDARAVDEISTVVRQLAPFNPVTTTGSAVSQQSVAPTLLWLQSHEPELWSRTRLIVGSYDWVLMRLGARPHVERNWALESGLFTVDGERFVEAFAAAQINASMIPEVVEPGRVVGALSSEMAERMGLPSGIPLVVGGADHVLSAYSAGVRAPGDWLVKLGGAGDVLVASETPLADERLYLDAHPVPGLWLPNGCMATSGSLIRWFQALTGGGELLRLDDEAATEPAAGLYCLPYFLGEKSPLHDPDLRGAFVGLHLGTSRGAMHRAVLESIAFGFRHHAEVFGELGLPLTRAMVTNGGSKSKLWKQIHADVLGTELHPIVDHPGASFGAAVIAAIGVGLLDAWTDVDRYISLGPTVHPDSAAAATYDAAYPEWRQLGAALEPFSHSLSRKAHA
ncbi:MAG: FGGY family carbohydrate kinase [Microcella sp.]|uniref:FGGY-family carbohydrate kinase n=1 Tax=Microcella sp. TaxID=1913979 RepID=UPI0027219C9B|nr:FGGY family carbohydrate kinase [Microcella sp.]MDO8338540.1 FGGY family carbohydrate kinase [Microcella sp.]